MNVIKTNHSTFLPEYIPQAGWQLCRIRSQTMLRQPVYCYSTDRHRESIRKCHPQQPLHVQRISLVREAARYAQLECCRRCHGSKSEPLVVAGAV